MGRHRAPDPTYTGRTLLTRVPAALALLLFAALAAIGVTEVTTPTPSEPAVVSAAPTLTAALDRPRLSSTEVASALVPTRPVVTVQVRRVRSHMPRPVPAVVSQSKTASSPKSGKHHHQSGGTP